MVRLALGFASWMLCSAGTEEEVNLLQTRANEDCTRSNRCKTTTTTTTPYTCADYSCPSGFFKSAGSGKVCGAECSVGECCKREETCGDHQCGADSENKGNGDKCVNNVCTDRQCCRRTTTTTTPHTCAGYGCPSGFFKSAGGGKVCRGDCSVDECCKREETCGDHQCGADSENKGNGDKCVNNVCTDRQCCQRTTTTTTRSSCDSITCPGGSVESGLRFCRGPCSTALCCKTTTTTTTPSTERFRETLPENCPIPVRPKVCHFWGEPHFTTLFNKQDSKNNFNEDRGGRIATNQRDLEFHDRGVFSVAKAHGHEVQAFFCPGPDINHDGLTGHDIHYDPTSSGNAIAVKMNDNSTIVMMRHPATKARNPDDWTNSNAMTPGSPKLVKIYVDGEEVEYKDIGVFGSGPERQGRNYALGEKIPKNARGKGLRENTFISQLKTKGDESEYATSPICVGDDSRNFLVDFSVPVLHGKWPLVFEASVTIFAKGPDFDGSNTLCGDSDMQNKIKSNRGYLKSAGSRFGVPLNKVLFSTKQIAELCNTCNMNNHDSSLCKTTQKNQMHQQHHVSFCETSNYSWDDAETSCKGSGIPASSPWYERCIIEQCASQGAGATLMHAEMAFTDYLANLR